MTQGIGPARPCVPGYCRTVRGVGAVRMALLLVAMNVLPAARVLAQPTLAGNTATPPPVRSTALSPPQTAVADPLAVVHSPNVSGLLQSILTAQGFSPANNWTLNTTTVIEDPSTTFNITTYSLYRNGAGTAFGETLDFTMTQNLPQLPAADRPAGSTVTEHWIQFLNESQKFNSGNGPFGYPIAGQPGFWQADNGDTVGGKPNGVLANTPYYNANGNGIVPNLFLDTPSYYSGIGTYLHFMVFPTWDVYVPAAGATPATDTIYVGDFGVSWGFSIVPEPSSIVMMFIGAGGLGFFVVRQARTNRPASAC